MATRSAARVDASPTGELDTEAPADASRAGLPVQVLRRRWDLVVRHREQLLRIARRRVHTLEDAEDVVTTAMIRTVEYDRLDESRIGPFLCTTVIRLAADVHRSRARELALGARDTASTVAVAPIDEKVCDDAEARWLAVQLRDCPERERQVLAARLAGVSARETPAHVGLSEKAAENAFTRLRQRALRLAAATLAVTGVATRLCRRIGKPSLAVVPVAAVTALAVLVVIHPEVAPAATAPTTTSREVAVVREAPAVRPQRSIEPAAQAAHAAAVDEADDGAGQKAITAAPRPTPVRTEVRVPAVVDRGTLDPGGLVVERRYEDESFEESLRRCLSRVDAGDVAADPCR